MILILVWIILNSFKWPKKVNNSLSLNIYFELLVNNMMIIERIVMIRLIWLKKKKRPEEYELCKVILNNFNLLEYIINSWI